MQCSLRGLDIRSIPFPTKDQSVVMGSGYFPFGLSDLSEASAADLSNSSPSAAAVSG